MPARQVGSRLKAFEAGRDEPCRPLSRVNPIEKQVWIAEFDAGKASHEASR